MYPNINIYEYALVFISLIYLNKMTHTYLPVSSQKGSPNEISTGPVPAFKISQLCSEMNENDAIVYCLFISK